MEASTTSLMVINFWKGFLQIQNFTSEHWKLLLFWTNEMYLVHLKRFEGQVFMVGFRRQLGILNLICSNASDSLLCGEPKISFSVNGKELLRSIFDEITACSEKIFGDIEI